MEKLANVIATYRWWFIALILIPAVFFGYSARDIKTDNSIEIWLKQDDPSLTFYNEFKKDFGNEEFLIIAIDDENVFSSGKIKLIAKTASKIKEINGVKDVISLASIFKEKLSSPYFKKRLAQEPDKSTLEVFKQEILNDKLYINNLISNDGKTTAIIAMVEGPSTSRHNSAGEDFTPDWTKFRKELVSDVRKIVYENFTNVEKVSIHSGESPPTQPSLISRLLPQRSIIPLPSNVHLAGPSVVNAELDRMSQEDLALFVPMMFCVSLVVLVILFRKLSGIVLPIAIIAMTNVWTMGVFALSGNTMNMISGIITPVIFIISLANSIHIINYYYSIKSPLSSNSRSIIETIKNIGTPCFFTCLTTAIGFLSLVTSDVLPLKITGLFTAVGIMFSFFISIVLIIFAFSLFANRDSRLEQQDDELLTKNKLQLQKLIFNTVLLKISGIVNKRTWLVFICGIVLTLIAIYGILQIKVESDLMKAFPADSEIADSNNHFEQHLTGLLPLEIVAEQMDKNRTIIENSALNSIDQLQDFIDGIDEVTFTISIVDFIKRVNSSINDGKAGHFKIPENDDTSLTYLNMASLHGGDSNIVNRFHTPDNSAGRISIRMNQIGSESYGRIVKRIDDYIIKNFPAGISAKLTGVVHLLIEMQDYLLASQIKTLSLAFAIIFLMMILLLHSVKLALISMIPNIMPIILTLGVMGFFSIRLDSGTVMIASVAIGIAVDDTIHFLYRFKKEHKGADYKSSVEETIVHVGRAMIFTSIVAFCGFMALCFSSFQPIKHFGLLTAITMVTALFADLFVLPCCLLIMRPSLK